MKIIIIGLTVLFFCFSTQTQAAWSFTESKDQFTGVVTFTASYDVELMSTGFTSFGLRCDTKSDYAKNALVWFSSEMPLAYYKEDIKFTIIANDRTFWFNGEMFSNSMSGGYASIQDDSQRDYLIDALAKGHDVAFRIDPDGPGEVRDQRLTLTGSSKAIEQWKAKCL